MEVEVEEHPDVNRCQRSSPPKKPFQSLCRIFTMARLSNSKTREHDAAKNVAVRVDRKFKNVKIARAKVWSFKCTKWVQECTSKFKSTAISAKEKDKSSLKVESAKNALERKSLRKLRLLKFQLKRVFLTTPQSLFQAKVMKFLMLWLVT